MRSRFSLVLMVIAALGCGGSSSDSTSPSTNGSSNSGSASGKTLTATYNGAQFTATLMTSVYAGGTFAINANDGTRTFSLTGLGANAPGTYSLAPGNSNTASLQWNDGANVYSTGYNGTGTVTFTVLQSTRTAGSFNVMVRTLGISQTVLTTALVGTFDIKFP